MSGAPKLRADAGVVLRTPLLPIDSLLAWAAAPRAFLEQVLARPEVREAIFLASPGLHASIERWRSDPAVERALVKYVARMAARSTPFGLFSGVSAGRLGARTQLELAPLADYRRRTRLDNDYLFVLAERLAGELRASLRFAPNTSLYRYGRELERYGGDRGIELAEELFWRDSEAALSIVELLEGDAGATARWQLALRGIDSLLAALGLDDRARRDLYAAARTSLGAEHRATTPLWSAIGARFQRDRAALDALFAPGPDHDLAPGLALLDERDRALAPVAAELARRASAGELTAPLSSIAWSLAHMHANRLLHASQRAQELVLSDYLRRLLASRAARSGV